VWLMRQAGRYMAAFREYSNRIPFRERSETPDIAIELSLQPWRAFKPDGVIMFSDILTPLPALGIEFDVIKGKGPVIATPIHDMQQIRELLPMDDPTATLPFVAETLQALCSEVGGAATVLGFIGGYIIEPAFEIVSSVHGPCCSHIPCTSKAPLCTCHVCVGDLTTSRFYLTAGTPWTLAAYSVEGKADKNCRKTKKMMLQQPEVLHALLSHLTEALIEYTCYQIEAGAQVSRQWDSEKVTALQAPWYRALTMPCYTSARPQA
jgi:uroporphyrinogen decarboxylase